MNPTKKTVHHFIRTIGRQMKMVSDFLPQIFSVACHCCVDDPNTPKQRHEFFIRMRQHGFHLLSKSRRGILAC